METRFFDRVFYSLYMQCALFYLGAKLCDNYLLLIILFGMRLTTEDFITNKKHSKEKYFNNTESLINYIKGM